MSATIDQSKRRNNLKQIRINDAKNRIWASQCSEAYDRVETGNR